MKNIQRGVFVANEKITKSISNHRKAKQVNPINEM